MKNERVYRVIPTQQHEFISSNFFGKTKFLERERAETLLKEEFTDFLFNFIYIISHIDETMREDWREILFYGREETISISSCGGNAIISSNLSTYGRRLLLKYP